MAFRYVDSRKVLPSFFGSFCSPYMDHLSVRHIASNKALSEAVIVIPYLPLFWISFFVQTWDSTVNIRQYFGDFEDSAHFLTPNSPVGLFQLVSHLHYSRSFS